MNKESVSNKLGQNILFGRARRIEFVEKTAYIIIAIISVILVFVIVGRNSTINDKNVNFAYLRKYLEDRGFSCELIYQPGGTCSRTKEAGQTSFVRQEDGLEYYEKTDGYLLTIMFTKSKGNYMTLKTTAYALSGYRNKTYTCYYKDNVFGEFDYCEDSAKQRLDSKTYNGIVEKAMYDLNNIMIASGYRKDKMLESYEWEK